MMRCKTSYFLIFQNEAWTMQSQNNSISGCKWYEVSIHTSYRLSFEEMELMIWGVSTLHSSAAGGMWVGGQRCGSPVCGIILHEILCLLLAYTLYMRHLQHTSLPIRKQLNWRTFRMYMLQHLLYRQWFYHVNQITFTLKFTVLTKSYQYYKLFVSLLWNLKIQFKYLISKLDTIEFVCMLQ